MFIKDLEAENILKDLKFQNCIDLGEYQILDIRNILLTLLSENLSLQINFRNSKSQVR